MNRLIRLFFTFAAAIAGVFVMLSSATAQVKSVSAVYETRAVFNDEADNKSSADDPAVWVHPTNPEKSLVIGTLKRGGMDVYDLKGNLVQHISGDPMPPEMQLEKARYNNVDLIYGFKTGPGRVDLAVASDRRNDMLRFFAIDPEATDKGRPLSLK